MGLISGSIHKRTTQRLVAPIRVVVGLEPSKVHSITKALCDSFEPRRGILSSGEKFWILGSTVDDFFVAYGPPAKNQPNTVVVSWKARITGVVDGSGRTLVKFQLTNWKTRDKQLVFKSEFEGFRDRFLERLYVADPSMTDLDAAPVAPRRSVNAIAPVATQAPVGASPPPPPPPTAQPTAQPGSNLLPPPESGKQWWES